MVDGVVVTSGSMVVGSLLVSPFSEAENIPPPRTLEIDEPSRYFRSSDLLLWPFGSIGSDNDDDKTVADFLGVLLTTNRTRRAR